MFEFRVLFPLVNRYVWYFNGNNIDIIDTLIIHMFILKSQASFDVRKDYEEKLVNFPH